MSRREAREIAFKLVFEYTFSREVKNEILDEYTIGLGADDVSYVKEVYFGVAAHYDEISQKIEKNIENFSFDRLFKVDFALLLLAIYEIEYVETIPFKVSIDEALTLAKKYSTEKSVGYINGVLSKFAGQK